MRGFFKNLKRWLAPASAPLARRLNRRLAIDVLEERATPADLAFTSVQFVDAAGSPLVVPTMGERVALRVSWSASALAPTDAYVLRGTVGGLAFDQNFTGATHGNGSYTATLSGWYALGSSTAYSIALDPANTLAETNEGNNNSAALTYTGQVPNQLPMKYLFPVSGSTPYTKWSISSYIDIDPNANAVRDWSNSFIAEDGSTGTDVEIASFGAQDSGLHRVIAMASGTVESITDTFFDRETANGGTVGNSIIINHGNGYRTEYFNLVRGSTTLRVGEGVAQGQPIGLVGASGVTDTPRLRFRMTHNNIPIDPYLAAGAYWTTGQTHQTLQTIAIVDQGTANYITTPELLERPLDTTVFPTTPPIPTTPIAGYWNVDYWVRLSHIRFNDVVTLRFINPSGAIVSTPFVTTATSTEINPVFRANLASTFYMNTPGSWRAEILVNGTRIGFSPFTVVSGTTGQPNFRVTAGGEFVNRNRTTAISFGSDALNGPGNVKTFTIQNVGSASMTVSSFVMPVGFAFSGPAPAPSLTLIPNQTMTFQVRMDTAQPGKKIGGLRFSTSLGTFSYFLEGDVAGAVPAGTPSLYLPGAAAQYFPSTSPILLDTSAFFSDSDNPTYNNGRLNVNFLNVTGTENTLAIRNQGTTAGLIGVSGANVTFGGSTIGTFAASNGASLTVTFNATATPAAIQALLRNLTYANTNPTPATGVRYLRVAVTDPGGRVSAPALKSVFPATAPSFSPFVTIAETGTPVASTIVTEGGAGDSYTVVLTTAPTANVTVNVFPISQVTTDKATLVFTNANWNVAQTVQITAINDAVAEGTHFGTITHTATSTDTRFNNVLLSVISPTILDNDGGVVVTPTFGTTDVAEGGQTDLVSFVLATAPTANVTVTLAPNSQTAVTPTTLTFTSATWNVPQTATISAVDDGQVEGLHSGSIAVSSASADPLYAIANVGTIPVTITDNDRIGVQYTSGFLTVAEGGGTTTFNIRLTSQPTANVSLSLAPVLPPQLTLTPAPIVFTPANWNIDQTITIAAVDDFVAEGLHTATLGFVVTTTDVDYTAYAPPTLAVDIIDNDTASITVTQSGGSTDVTEGGATDTITVVLTSEPVANVIVSLNVNAQLTTNPTSITFTAANWNVPQTVIVTAFDDAALESAHSAPLNFIVTSGDLNYDAYVLPTITVNITDNDSASLIVTPTGGSNDVIEGSAAFDTFTLALSAQTPPVGDVTITLLPDAQVTTNVTILTFTPANWTTPQSVNVSSVDDFVAEGLHVGRITVVTQSVDPRFNAMVLPQISVSVTDNDNAGITLAQSAGTTEVTEGGNSDSVTLVLSSEPTATVLVAVNIQGTQIAASLANVLFTPGNWNQPQTITFGADDDTAFEGQHSAMVNFGITTTDSRYSSLAVPTLTVTIYDNDAPAVLVDQSGVGTSVNESGPGDSFTLSLSTAPSSNVVVTLGHDTQISLSGTSFTFTPANYNIPQTVTIVATLDSIAEGNLASTINPSAASADPLYNGIFVPPIVVTVVDDDFANVNVNHTGGSTSLAEAGGTDIVLVTLASQPTADVVLDLQPGTQLTVDKTSLLFTAANWNVAQFVTLAAVDDFFAEGVHFGTLTFAISSADPAYSSQATATFDAPIADNDVAGIHVAETGGSTVLTEGVGNEAYAVVLTSRPTANVVVTIAAQGTGVGQVTITPTTLTFTPDNWSVTQNVQIDPINDTVAEPTLTFVITNVATSADPVYSGATRNVSVTLSDNDVPAIVIFPLSGIINAREGDPASTYTVNLGTQPTSDVTVTLAPDANLAVSPLTVTFTAANWNVAQTVYVTPIDDTIPEETSAAFVAHSSTSSDPTYSGRVGPSLTVNVADNDIGIVFRHSGGDTTVREAELPDTYQVLLSQAPTASVTIQITPPAPLVANPTSLTFGPADWNVAKAVTLSAPSNFAADGARALNVAHAATSADANYNGSNRPLPVTLRDGLPDVVGRATDGTWHVSRSTGSAFQTTTPVAWSGTANWVDVFVADVNADGRDDFIGRELGSGDWWVSASSGASGFVTTNWGKWATTVTWVGVVVGDFNNDKRADIMGRTLQGGEWWAAVSTGSSFAMSKFASWSPTVTWVDVRAADFNGDGRTDIASRTLQGGEWWVGLSNGSSLATTLWATWSTKVTWVDVQAADFNGDGKTDVMGRVAQSGEWWGGITNAAGAAFVTSSFGAWSPSVAWTSVAAIDFNGDGRADLVGREGDRFWVSLTGVGTFSSTTLWGSGSIAGLSDVRYRDFNGDGKADVVGRDAATGQLLVRLTNAGGTAFLAPAAWGVLPTGLFRDVWVGLMY